MSSVEPIVVHVAGRAVEVWPKSLSAQRELDYQLSLVPR